MINREDVVMLVLVNGQHVLGELVHDDNGGYLLKNPCMIVPNHQTATLAFVPHSVLQFTTNNVCEFLERDISHVLRNIRDDLLDQYLAHFGGGLQIAPNPGLILA